MEPETLNMLLAVFFFWWLEVKGCPKRTDSLLRMRWSLDTPGISSGQLSQRVQMQTECNVPRKIT